MTTITKDNEFSYLFYFLYSFNGEIFCSGIRDSNPRPYLYYALSSPIELTSPKQEINRLNVQHSRVKEMILIH